MGKEQEQIIKQYINLLNNDFKHNKAVEMTADLFGVDEETIKVILEDAEIIPREDYMYHNLYSNYGLVMECSTDTYYRKLSSEKNELQKERDRIDKQIKDLDEKLKMVEEYAKGILEIRDANKKANKG